eukprot:jgi/Orpsp1_1/1188033/evm.model.d7180000061987.1
MKNILYLFATLLLLSFTSAKRCGKGFGKCPEGQCCSKHGYCGKLEVYCGGGCQSEFGKCNNVEIQENVKDDKDEKLSEKIVDIVDAILNEDLSDDESKNEVVEEVINELANEIDVDSEIENDSENENENENNEEDDSNEVIEDKDNNEEEEEDEEIEEAQEENDDESQSEEETESQINETTEVESIKDEKTSVETENPETSTSTTVPTTTESQGNETSEAEIIKDENTSVETENSETSTSTTVPTTTESQGNETSEVESIKDENTSVEIENPETSTSIIVPTITETKVSTSTTTTTTTVITTITKTTENNTSTSAPISSPTPSNPSNECSTEILGMAQPFNAFFFGDFTGFSSDVQGRLAAKGTVNISGGYQNGAFTYDPVKHNQQTYLNCNDDIMKGDIKYSIVAGNLNFRDGGEILNGGVAYQNSVDLPGYIREAIERHHCPIEKKNFIDFEKEKKNLIALSEKLGNMKENTKTKNEWGKLVIDLVPGQKLYVINISNINEFWNIDIKENGVNTDEITIIFNIPNEDIVTFSNYDISGLNKYATRILWNVPNASKILIQNFRIQGSLLAPKSDIEGYNGNIQGQIIGNSFKGNLQMDWVPFYGCL